MADPKVLWPAATKRAEETLPVTLSLFSLCAVYWEPNEQWDPGEFSWPTQPIGFVLECASGVSGRSGGKEPRWKSNPVAGATFVDGSLEWTLRVPTINDGIQPISNPVAVPAAGIDVVGLAVDENTKLLVDYEGGTRGKTYEVGFQFEIAGRLRFGSQLVQVV